MGAKRPSNGTSKSEQTDTQTNTQTNKHTDKQTHRQTNTHMDISTNRKRCFENVSDGRDPFICYTVVNPTMKLTTKFN